MPAIQRWACLGCFVVGLVGCDSSGPAVEAHVPEKPAEPAKQGVPEPSGRPFRLVDGQIVADVFDLRYDVRDGSITVALDTDLGSAATVMVSISRSYWEKGDSE